MIIWKMLVRVKGIKEMESGKIPEVIKIKHKSRMKHNKEITNGKNCNNN